jgi:hypothetical protein
MNKLKVLALSFTTVLMAAMPLSAHAVDYWVGYTFIHDEDTHFCVIARFRAYDGSFSLNKADSLYKIIADQVDGLGISETTTLNHTFPSENNSQGVTGEGLGNAFLADGVATCTVGGEPVDAMIFLSAFNCEYQNENQLCLRLYVDTGATDITFLGIPRGPAAIGGIFIKREVWDATSALILGNPGLIPSLPLALPVGETVGTLLNLVISQQETKALQEEKYEEYIGSGDVNPF